MIELPPSDAPPAPPPPPPEGWRGSVPTSGYAVASLVFGISGLVFCVLLAPVGLVLGAVAIGETGRDGTRSGRGLAIAGLAVSVLSLVGNVLLIAFFLGAMPSLFEPDPQPAPVDMAVDAGLIVQRLQEYYSANGNSLAAGGPVLAGELDDQRVEGRLEVSHLVYAHELAHSRHTRDWQLTVTSRNRATLTALSWSGETLLQWQITDAGKGRYIEVPRSTNR